MIDDDNFDEFEHLFKSEENKPLYIGNFMDLNNTHLPMLEQIKLLYLKDDNECSLNIQSITPIYYCLHFHVVSKAYYISNFTKHELGLRLYASLNIIRILNNINFYEKYYNYFNLNILDLQ